MIKKINHCYLIILFKNIYNFTLRSFYIQLNLIKNIIQFGIMDLIYTKDIDKYFENNLLKKYINFIKILTDSKNNINYNILIKNTSSFLSRKLINSIIKNIFSINFDPTIKINEHQLHSNKNIIFFTKTSQYHIEIKPSDYGIYDKNIINEYLKETASSTNILLGSRKTIVIWNIDYLSSSAQDALQNILSMYGDSANFIMTCSDYFKLSSSILSKSYQLNIKNITQHDIIDMCTTVSSINIPTDDLQTIIDKSKISFDFYDMGLFLHFLYLEKFLPYISQDDKELLFHRDIKKFYKTLRGTININSNFLEFVRNSLYEYYVNHINSSDFLKSIINLTISDNTLLDKQKTNIVYLGAYYDYNSNKGNKAIIHLEAFIIELLNIFISEE
jgi:replication factor C subunit 3/5